MGNTCSNNGGNDGAPPVHPDAKDTIDDPFLTTMGKPGVKVVLNVYNLQPKGNMNEAIGFGAYHSGVVIHNAEFTFGGHPQAVEGQPGIFAIPPKAALPPDQFHKEHVLGHLPPTVQMPQLMKCVQEMHNDWTAKSYNLLKHNCNHFSTAFVEKLSREHLIPAGYKPLEVPSYVNRAARTGSFFVPDRIINAMMKSAPKPPEGQTMPGQGAGGCNHQHQHQHGHQHQHTSHQQQSTRATPPPQPAHAQPKQQQQPQQPTAAAERKPLPSTRAELERMSIKELRTAMWMNGVSSEGCIEKTDLVDACLLAAKK